MLCKTKTDFQYRENKSTFVFNAIKKAIEKIGRATAEMITYNTMNMQIGINSPNIFVLENRIAKMATYS